MMVFVSFKGIVLVVGLQYKGSKHKMLKDFSVQRKEYNKYPDFHKYGRCM